MRWPDGKVENFLAIAAGQIVTLQEGKDRAETALYQAMGIASPNQTVLLTGCARALVSIWRMKVSCGKTST